jgi:hypothetical protein
LVLDTYDVELEDVAADGGSGGGSGGDMPEIAMSLVVEDGMVEVVLEDIEIAPCEDFAATAVVWEQVRVVSGSFVNADCGTPEMYNVRWSFPAPEQSGEWQLLVWGEQAFFTIE